MYSFTTKITADREKNKLITTQTVTPIPTIENIGSRLFTQCAIEIISPLCYKCKDGFECEHCKLEKLMRESFSSNKTN